MATGTLGQTELEKIVRVRGGNICPYCGAAIKGPGRSSVQHLGVYRQKETRSTWNPVLGSTALFLTCRKENWNECGFVPIPQPAGKSAPKGRAQVRGAGIPNSQDSTLLLSTHATYLQKSRKLPTPPSPDRSAPPFLVSTQNASLR
ncbi:hypothetical protein KIL84_021144 [Mauremys mutica]|uniref:Uncharacterized protein n=1 Tax=Mauremys mutica TaxID=74926 RepID=A0A9D3XBY4_9SAUR|nr:hypothetical protein KIL84_021144 [Mauremys mutica]